MFSNKNVNGLQRTFMTITLFFYEFQSQTCMNNLDNPCRIATHESYRPQHIPNLFKY
jgi:hypothetical protein